MMAKAKAEALREVELDAYHDQSPFDMFLYRGDSSEELKAKLERAREILQSREFEVDREHDRKRIVTGVSFTFGIGMNLDEADSTDLLNQGRRPQARAAVFLNRYKRERSIPPDIE